MDNTDLVVGEFVNRSGGRERRRDTGARLERKDMPVLIKRVGWGRLRHREVQKKRPIWFCSAGFLEVLTCKWGWNVSHDVKSLVYQAKRSEPNIVTTNTSRFNDYLLFKGQGHVNSRPWLGLSCAFQ